MGFLRYNVRLNRADEGVCGRTGINPVKVVKIWCKSEAFNSAFDVLFNVGGRVGDSATAEDIETTFRGN